MRYGLTERRPGGGGTVGGGTMGGGTVGGGTDGRGTVNGGTGGWLRRSVARERLRFKSTVDAGRRRSALFNGDL